MTLRIVKPSHFWQADEKGVNDESMAKCRLLRSWAAGGATADVGRGIRHMSVLTFACADGGVAPPCVVVAGKKYHPDMAQLWPEALITSHEKGSFTAELWVETLVSCFAKHIRGTLGLDGTVVLYIDSGGGRRGMHLSLEAVLACDKYGIDLQVMEAHHTRAIMSLDRTPHAQMEIEWGGSAPRLHVGAWAPTQDVVPWSANIKAGVGSGRVQPMHSQWVPALWPSPLGRGRASPQTSSCTLPGWRRDIRNRWPLCRRCRGAGLGPAFSG